MRIESGSSGGLAVGEADSRYLRLAGGTLTGELSALAGLNTTRPYSSGLVPQDSSNPLPAFPFVTEWNNAGKDWTAVRISVTNTASGSASKLADFQVGGSSKAFIDKAGKAVFSNWIYLDGIGSSAYFGWVGGAILTDRRFLTPGLDCYEYVDITEMSAPAAPAANTARLYVEDNGSGKTRLCVRFPTGAVQVLATEP